MQNWASIQPRTSPLKFAASRDVTGERAAAVPLPGERTKALTSRTRVHDVLIRWDGLLRRYPLLSVTFTFDDSAPEKSCFCLGKEREFVGANSYNTDQQLCNHTDQSLYGLPGVRFQIRAFFTAMFHKFVDISWLNIIDPVISCWVRMDSTWSHGIITATRCVCLYLIDLLPLLPYW